MDSFFRGYPCSAFPDLSHSRRDQKFIFHFTHRESLEPADLVFVQLHTFPAVSPSCGKYRFVPACSPCSFFVREQQAKILDHGSRLIAPCPGDRVAADHWHVHGSWCWCELTGFFRYRSGVHRVCHDQHRPLDTGRYA